MDKTLEKEYEFNEGVMNGTPPFKICFSFECFSHGKSPTHKPCKHCINYKEESPGEVFEVERTWICPIAIVVDTQAQDDMTILCVHCFMDAMMDVGEKSGVMDEVLDSFGKKEIRMILKNYVAEMTSMLSAIYYRSLTNGLVEIDSEERNKIKELLKL